MRVFQEMRGPDANSWPEELTNSQSEYAEMPAAAWRTRGGAQGAIDPARYTLGGCNADDFSRLDIGAGPKTPLSVGSAASP